MLKTPEQGAPGPTDERSVGDLVHQLVEDGKAYARAEAEVARAMAAAKAEALKLPAILFGAALLVAQAAVTVLAVAVFHLLESALGPLAAGLVATLVFAGVAGGLAWLGVKKLKEGL